MIQRWSVLKARRRLAKLRKPGAALRLCARACGRRWRWAYAPPVDCHFERILVSQERRGSFSCGLAAFDAAAIVPAVACSFVVLVLAQVSTTQYSDIGNDCEDMCHQRVISRQYSLSLKAVLPCAVLLVDPRLCSRVESRKWRES